MLLVILKYVSCDLLNHIHDVGCKSIALEGPLTYTLDLTPDKVKNAEGPSIRCHPMEQVPGVIYDVSLISTLAINGLPEHPFQVPIGRVKTNNLPNCSSLTSWWVHVGKLLWRQHLLCVDPIFLKIII